MKMMRELITIGLCATALQTAVATAAEPGAAGAAAASAYVAPKMQHDRFGQVDIVVPLTTDDKRVHGMKLRNITNGLKAAEEWHGTFNVRVVLYAKGITLLQDPDEATRTQLDALRSRGVKFEVCNNTLRENGIDFHTLYNVTDADIVPSGFAEVAYLQARKHFAVDPVN